jgi:hypothetical protein
MKKTLTCTALFVATAMILNGFATVSFAETTDKKISELEAKQAYDKASKDFSETLESAQRTADSFEGSNETDNMTGEDMSESIFGDVAIVSDEAIESIINEPETGYLPISQIRLTVNAERKTLKAIVDDILKQAAPKSGAWNVKWRLSEDNQFLLRERVNLTAETNFEQFMDYLTDRINNMTGINLFVSVFEASRIIVISDTYY